jgi:hypothetical protein
MPFGGHDSSFPGIPQDTRRRPIVPESYSLTTQLRPENGSTEFNRIEQASVYFSIKLVLEDVYSNNVM